jgi:hypothetical protein
MFFRRKGYGLLASREPPYPFDVSRMEFGSGAVVMRYEPRK